MRSLDNGELPEHFEFDFCKITSAHNYQTRLASLQSYHLPRMKISLSWFSLVYIGLKLYSEIPKTWKSLSSFSFGKQHRNVLSSCQ